MTDDSLQENVQALLKSNPKHHWSAREILRKLDIPASERASFKRKLKQLSQENKIIRVKGGRYCLSMPHDLHQASSVTGLLRLHYDGYGFVIPEEGGVDVFVPADSIYEALPMDRVRVQILEERKDGRKKGRILDVLGRGRSHWIGRFEKRGKKNYAINSDFAVDLVIEIIGTLPRDLKMGDLVSIEITEYPTRTTLMRGNICEVLGVPDDDKIQEQTILIRHGISQKFPSDVLQAVTDLPHTDFYNQPQREDLRELPFLTIDGPNAKDFDDAVHLKKTKKGYHLFVSIADVAHYVKPFQTIDAEALKRGTSVYFPDFAVPMLPERLSNDLCSLRPKEDRPTITCEMEFDKQGVMIHARFYESLICSQVRGVYEEVQDVLLGRPNEKIYSNEMVKQLREMQELALLLIQQKKKRGALDFELPEPEIIYDSTGRIKAIIKTKRLFSHCLIEEFMIAANVAVASLLHQGDIPVLYRVHDKPEKSKAQNFYEFLYHMGIPTPHLSLSKPRDYAKLLDSFRAHPLQDLIHQMLLRTMRVAIYDSENRGHFGLALTDYCHFTSPIRRYPDLVVHRQLKSWLSQVSRQVLSIDFPVAKTINPKRLTQRVKLPHQADQIKELGLLTSQAERAAMDAEREMMDYKKALFMRQHVGEEYWGIVKRITKFGMFLELDPYFVEGLLHVNDMTDDYYVFDEKRIRLVGRSRRKKKIHKIGDKLKVLVADVSLEKRVVSLVLV